MIIEREVWDKIQGLRLVGLHDVLVNAHRIQNEDDTGYDLGHRHGVRMLTERILEAYHFTKEETDIFFKYASALESEDHPLCAE